METVFLGSSPTPDEGLSLLCLSTHYEGNEL